MGEPKKKDISGNPFLGLETQQRADEAASIPRTVVNTPPSDDGLQRVPALSRVYEKDNSGGPPPDPTATATAGNTVFNDPNAPAAPATQPAAPESAGVGGSASGGADLPPLSDVSSTSSGGTTKHIFRPEDVKASDAANREAALKQGGVLAAQAATGAEVGKIQTDYANHMVKSAADHEAQKAALTAKMEARIKASDDAVREFADKASKLPYGTWLNPNAGQKVASIIGLLLSGVGSGLAKQPNLAAAMLEQEYQNAWKQHESMLAAGKMKVSGARDAVANSRASLLDNIRSYDDFRIGAAEATKAKIDAAVALHKTPEAQAAAEALKAKMNADIADATLKRNEVIKQSTYSSHRASELDSALKVENAARARLAFNMQYGKQGESILKYVEKEAQTRGIQGGKDAWKRAYDASNGLTNIPSNFAIQMSNVRAGSNQTPSGILDAFGKMATGWLSGAATSTNDRLFAAALGDITRAATKAGERGQTTERDAIAYELNSGFGPNTTPEQKAQSLWRVRDILNRGEARLLEANGLNQATYNQLVPDNLVLPARPTAAAAPGVTKKTF